MSWEIENKIIVRILPIGITGLAHVGKDTVADAIISSRNHEYQTVVQQQQHQVIFKKYALAKSLKLAASTIFNIPFEDFTDPDKKEVVNPNWGMSPRKIAQLFGTEAMRSTFGPDIWVKSLITEIENNVSDMIGNGMKSFTYVPIIADVRFDNEAEFVNSCGGNVYRLINSMHKPIALNGHASENGVSEKWIDLTFNNNFPLPLGLTSGNPVNHIAKQILDQTYKVIGRE